MQESVDLPRDRAMVHANRPQGLPPAGARRNRQGLMGARLVARPASQHGRDVVMASVTSAVATRGVAPYSAVVSHGLALDELGRKMSKSLGNFEYASEVVNRVGADVFRLVFASVDYTSDMNVGENLFGAVSEAYRKIRNTCRYMLGNLNDFDPARDVVAPADMLEFDPFIMARTEKLKPEVPCAYEQFDFQAAYYAILNFVVIDLSSLYIDVARDRLYCSGAASRERRSAQTALYLILDTLVRMLAPLIPYTADEIYSHVPGKTADTVHLLTLHAPDPPFSAPALTPRSPRSPQSPTR